MSQENVEIVQRFYASGPSDLLKAEAQVDQAFRDFLDEDFEVRWPPTWPEGEQVFRGREGLAELFATLRGSWAEWRVQPERFLDAGDRVVVFVRMRARGAASGAEIEFERAQVWSFRGDRATSMRIYVDRSEALETVGLRD